MKTKTRKLSSKIIDFVMTSSSNPEGQPRVTEETIASHFKISRTPVREVIKHLEHEGLIRTRPCRGITFMKFSADDIEKICAVRIALEETAARDAVKNITSGILDKLRSYARAYRDAHDGQNREKAVTADEFFHELIIECSGNWYLKNMIKKIRMLDILFHADKRGMGLSQDKKSDLNPYSHDKIIEALATGDPETAAETLRNHIIWSRDRMLQSMYENSRKKKREVVKSKNL